MKNVQCLIIMAAMLLPWAASACAARPAATETAPTPGAVTLAATARPAWQEDWERTLAAARNEGKLVVSSGAGPAVRDGLAPPLLEKFGLEMEYFSAKGAEIAEKISRERQAGIYSTDIFTGGSTTVMNVMKPRGFLDPLEPVLLLPEVRNPAVWVGNQFNFVDKDRMVLAFATEVGIPLALNTELVQPGEIRSYRDLLLPKWKGKIVLNDPTIAGIALEWYSSFVGARILDVDFMRQLASQEPVINRDARLQVEWLAHGKYSILICPNAPTLWEFKKAGAPVAALIPTEGTNLKSGSGNVALMNRAPHPNAARLFINWLLTKEGQLHWQNALGIQSARLDVPPGSLDPMAIRQEGLKYVLSGDEQFLLDLPDKMKEAREIFGRLIK